MLTCAHREKKSYWSKKTREPLIQDKHKRNNHLQKPGKPGIGDQSWNARSGKTPILIVSYGPQVKKNVDITTVRKVCEFW